MMPNDIGSVRGVSGTSLNHNTQAGQGTQKPSFSGGGTSNPMDTKPPKPADASVPMPK